MSERNSFIYYDFRFLRYRREKDNWITSRRIYPKTAADKRQADNNSIHDLFEFLYLYNETKIFSILWLSIKKFPLPFNHQVDAIYLNYLSPNCPKPNVWIRFNL